MLRFFARVNMIVITWPRGGCGHWYWPPGFVFLRTWGWGSAAEALTGATLDEAMSTPPGKAGYLSRFDSLRDYVRTERAVLSCFAATFGGIFTQLTRPSLPTETAPKYLFSQISSPRVNFRITYSMAKNLSSLSEKDSLR